MASLQPPLPNYPIVSNNFAPVSRSSSTLHSSTRDFTTADQTTMNSTTVMTVLLFPESGITMPPSITVTDSSAEAARVTADVSFPEIAAVMTAHTVGVSTQADGPKGLIPPRSIGTAHSNVVSPSSATKVSPPPQPKASFADKLKARDGSPTEQVSKPRDVPAHDFTILRPELVDLKRCLVLEPSFHQRQVRRFAHAVHGRLILRKGESPRFAADLWQELQQLWKPSAGWSIHPLGKGYFTFNFTTDEDRAAAFAKTTWRLRSGILHLQAWVPNFDPYKAHSTLVHVWIRIFNLPHEYWHPEVLSGVAREVGMPILIDGQSAQAHVGHFARILVELDVSADLPEALDIKCGDIDFTVKFGYENLPYYCFVCKVVGHISNECRRRKTTTTEEGFTEHQGRERGQSKVDDHRVHPRPYTGNQESPARAGKEAAFAEVGQELNSSSDSPTSSNPFAVLVSLELQDEQRLVCDDNMDKPPSDGGRASDACIYQDNQDRKDLEQLGSDDEKSQIEVVEQEHERTTAPLLVQPLAVMTDNNDVLTLTGTTGPISRRRGRPKGAINKKGRVSDSSIKHRLRRIIINGMSSNFQNSARRDDMQGPAHAMSVVASSKMKKKWGDMLDDEDDDVLDEDDPLKMFS
ncbi:uncharacterized protein LOC131018045 [Salvia miltiorrhiza]|uniref:uncharacterized protein LOC131018045 n=1 Tax=Salvia miltiorrhiza TaxID=226208 RepID=UPI0025AD75FA|nr:uncharacterized protein LOC131018045 [Salvia miltiorrhiza]